MAIYLTLQILPPSLSVHPAEIRHVPRNGARAEVHPLLKLEGLRHG
jgi:hypothetical protein